MNLSYVESSPLSTGKMAKHGGGGDYGGDDGVDGSDDGGGDGDRGGDTEEG